MEKENISNETAEELEAEDKLLAEVKEDDIREEVISDYGFVEEDDKEKIDKLVTKEVDHRKKLIVTIGQKRKYRDELVKAKTPKVDESKSKEDDKNLNKKDIAKAIKEGIEEGKLEDMEYPDDLKKVSKNVAKINSISVKSATSDPYVKAKIEAWKTKKEAEESSLNRTNKGGKKSNSDPMMPPDVDMSTKEGVAEYDKWKADAIKQEKKDRA